MVFIPGKTGVITKVNTNETKSTELESTFTLMEADSKGNGVMVNKTAQE